MYFLGFWASEFTGTLNPNPTLPKDEAKIRKLLIKGLKHEPDWAVAFQDGLFGVQGFGVLGFRGLGCRGLGFWGLGVRARGLGLGLSFPGRVRGVYEVCRLSADFFYPLLFQAFAVNTLSLQPSTGIAFQGLGFRV